MKNFTQFILIILALILVSGCSGFFKRSDVKDNPINVEDRVRKNIEEGRGASIGSILGSRGGTNYEFSTSNPLWRATLETLDFLPLSTV